MSKNVKIVESIVQVFTFLHLLLTDTITVKQLHSTHMPCYIYVKTVHFWLKYNGLAIARKTTKLIVGGHRGLLDYRHICYYFYVFYVFFQNPKSRDFRTFSRTMTTTV